MQWSCVCVEGVKAAVQAAVVTTDSLVHLITHALSSSHCRTAGHHHGTTRSSFVSDECRYTGRLINTSYITLYAVFRVDLMKVTSVTSQKVIKHRMVVVVNYEVALVAFYIFSLFTSSLSVTYDFPPSLSLNLLSLSLEHWWCNWCNRSPLVNEGQMESSEGWIHWTSVTDSPGWRPEDYLAVGIPCTSWSKGCSSC